MCGGGGGGHRNAKHTELVGGAGLGCLGGGHGMLRGRCLGKWWQISLLEVTPRPNTLTRPGGLSCHLGPQDHLSALQLFGLGVLLPISRGQHSQTAAEGVAVPTEVGIPAMPSEIGLGSLKRRCTEGPQWPATQCCKGTTPPSSPAPGGVPASPTRALSFS